MTAAKLPEKLTNYCLSSYKMLIIDSYGNYILQRMITRNRQLLTVAASHCLFNLEKLVDDAFASRFMQSAAQVDLNFRMAIFDRFGRQPTLFIQSVSGVFLMLAAIKGAASDQEYRQPIANLLMQKQELTNPNLDRYTCRILVAVIETSSD